MANVLNEVALHPLPVPAVLIPCTCTVVAPVVTIGSPLLYGFHVLPFKVYWYASEAPVPPPLPAVPVTVPVLKPAHITEPSTGLATLNVGATGWAFTVNCAPVEKTELKSQPTVSWHL